MGLFTPIYMKKYLSNKNLTKAEAKLKKLKPKKLNEAAKNAPDWDVRRTAVRLLTDQAVLAEVALNDPSIGMYAYKKLTGMIDYKKFARMAKDGDVRKAAVKKLTDQTVLAEVALKNEYLSVRYAAIEKLTDQTVLAKIALKDENYSVRKAAVEKLTDQTVLVEVALKDEDEDVRSAAVKKLTDQTVLAKVALKDENYSVRYAAVKNLTDKTVLTEVALKDMDENVREAAVKKLLDRTVSAEIIDVALVKNITAILKSADEGAMNRAVFLLKKIYISAQTSDEVKRYIRAHEGNYCHHSDYISCSNHGDFFGSVYFDVQ